MATRLAFADTKAMLKSVTLLARTTDKGACAKSAFSAVLRPLARTFEKLGLNSDALKGLGGYPLKGKEFALKSRVNAIRDEISATMGGKSGAWTLRAQLRRDVDANPVEDASVVWPDESNPYLPLATMTVQSQEA